jgi:hypothetical protein
VPCPASRLAGAPAASAGIGPASVTLSRKREPAKPAGAPWTTPIDHILMLSDGRGQQERAPEPPFVADLERTLCAYGRA